MGGRSLWLEWARGPSSAAKTDLASCRLGNSTVGIFRTWENTIWK